MCAPYSTDEEEALTPSRRQRVTLPEPTQPGCASDSHGPLSAAWNCGEFGSIPLPGPSWPLWPLGSGKSGTPCARMHLAKARLKLPADRCPDPPAPDPAPPAVTFPVAPDADATVFAGPPPHAAAPRAGPADAASMITADRKSTRLNSSHLGISYAV